MGTCRAPPNLSLPGPRDPSGLGWDPESCPHSRQYPLSTQRHSVGQGPVAVGVGATEGLWSSFLGVPVEGLGVGPWEPRGASADGPGPTWAAVGREVGSIRPRLEGVDTRWTHRGCLTFMLGLSVLAGGWAGEDPQAPRRPPVPQPPPAVPVLALGNPPP